MGLKHRVQRAERHVAPVDRPRLYLAGDTPEEVKKKVDRLLAKVFGDREPTLEEKKEFFARIKEEARGGDEFW